MGFFKNLKNSITGGAASVHVNVPTARRGQAVPVQITATAKADGKVAAVYLLVRGMESAEWKDSGQRVANSRTSYETRIQIAGPLDIKEGQTYNFEGQLELPINSSPTFRGQLINHLWEVQAGLDMPGNDPDSGWQNVEVQ
ncbi:MAG TPA: hypothetical protein VGM90_09030 [Kofleriaceae bacterium]|jgi:hypothetical protein